MKALNSNIFVEMQGDLAVRARAQAVTGFFELTLDRLIAVEFAVHDDARLTIFAGDRLLPAAEIDDTQPRVTKSNATVRRYPMALPVRATMAEALRGAAQCFIRD